MLFLEAWYFLALARFILVFIPFSKFLPLLGTPIECEYQTVLSESKFRDLKLSIKRACKYSFWRTMCFEQALCAKLMLRLRGKKTTIFFGIKRDSTSNIFLAHAWLICDNEIITGEAQVYDFKVLSCFYG